MKALVLYWDPQHWPLAREALRQAGRRDLIGNGPDCLVPNTPPGAVTTAAPPHRAKQSLSPRGSVPDPRNPRPARAARPDARRERRGPSAR
jgi:hypothetical protein